ncbi:hypothetical protein Tco_0643946 [Tanacetum coccineum]
MFHATLKLTVETPEQPFIPLASLKYIQPFLKIVGYQGLVDKAYKDYEEKYEGVEVPIFQPKPVKSTQGTHRTLRATRIPNPNDVQKPISTTIPPPNDDQERDEIHSATLLSLAIHKTAKIVEEQENVAAVKEKILEEYVEKIVEGADKESYASEFADTVLLEKEDSGNRIEPRSHKENPKNIDDDEMKDNKKDDDYNDDDDQDDQKSKDR